MDFWLPKPLPFDREMLRRRAHMPLFGEPAWITTAEDSILHKLIWNRITPSDRQMGDAAAGVAAQGEKLDQSYLKQWAEALGAIGELNKLLIGEITPKLT